MTDIVSKLPIELRQKVLSYLSPEELAICSGVNKLWRSLVNDNYLWRKFTPVCERNVSIEYLKPSGLEPLCKHRLWYNRHRTSLLKWKKGEYWIHNLDKEAYHAVIGNGAILVVWKQDQLKVYDLNENSSNFTQSINFHSSSISLSGVSYSSTDGIYLIIKDSANVHNLCFKWTGDHLVFVYSVLAIYMPNCKVELTLTEPSKYSSNDYEVCPSTVQLVTSSDIFISVSNDIYIWSTDDRKCRCTVKPGSKVLRVYSHNYMVYVCCPTQMFVYNMSGVQMYRVAYHRQESFRYRDVKFHFNDRTILGVFTSPDGWYYHSAWGKDCRQLGDPFYIEQGGSPGGVLHPSLPEACCYVLPPDTDSRHTYRISSSFITKDLRTNCILWETDIDTIVIWGQGYFTDHWSFVYLSDSHILYFYNGEMKDKVIYCYVVDLKTREVTESKIYSCEKFNAYLRYTLNPKIISCDLSTEQSFRKLFVFT